ncbi:MAG TPA: aminotransferase class IV [Anaerolineae bacterium]|nr:aminotransferase class IV [Anaerolineae bacterium]
MSSYTYRGTHDAVPDERNEHVLIYVNGELVPRAEARISVFDSGFLIGDGVWEGLRLHHDVLVFLDEHLDRLYQGAKAIALDIGLTRAEITEALYRTVHANDMHDNVHMRLMITRGIKKTPSQDPRLTISPPTIVIIAEHKQVNPAVFERGVRLFTSTIRRPPPDTLDPKLNCHSKLHEVIALNQAIQAGADEALMLDVHGAVSTCNATNFFIVVKGQVWTSTGQHCLNGITRRKIIEVCRAQGIPVFEKDFSLTDVYSANESFVTGTFGGLTPVVEVDDRPISTGQPGEMTRRLREWYLAEIERNTLR